MGMLWGIGFLPSIDFFAILPTIRPRRLLGGVLIPAAISNQAEQCAIIWAGVILPHCLGLSGVRLWMRLRSPVMEAGSKRLFTEGFPRAFSFWATFSLETNCSMGFED